MTGLGRCVTGLGGCVTGRGGCVTGRGRGGRRADGRLRRAHDVLRVAPFRAAAGRCVGPALPVRDPCELARGRPGSAV